jgi:hypothetical protein
MSPEMTPQSARFMSDSFDADTPSVVTDDGTGDVALEHAGVADESPLWSIDRPMMFAIAALVAVILASGLSIVLDVQRIHIVNQVQTDLAVHATYRYAADEASARASDNHTSIAADAEGVAVIAAGIAFLFWFYRAYANLSMLGAPKQRFALGWAIWSWIIPILSLFRPKQIANDIWRGSDPDNPHREPDPRAPVSPLVHWWWAVFLLNNFIAVISLNDWNSSNAPSAVKHAALVDVLSSSVSIVAAALAAATVYVMTARQLARARARDETYY